MGSRNKNSLRACYFGTYSKEEGYPRNRVIIDGLRKNGAEVIECHEDFWEDTSQKLEGVKAGSGIVKILYRLLRTYLKLIRKFRHMGDYDALIVGYAGHIDIFLAKLLNLFRGKPLIFDAFLSLYDTAVMDRKIVSRNSLKARFLWRLDRWACKIADAVLLDTHAHVDYFVREFRLPAGKFHAVPVGSYLQIPLNPLSNSPQSPFRKRGGSLFPPLEKGGQGGFDRRFSVLYFGAYIPLHGVDVILQAAKIVQDKGNAVLFTLVGTGQLLPAMKELTERLGLKNVIFIERFVSEEELVGYIRQADVCLGVFGQTDKAGRVIPCKVYNSLAMGKPLITMSGPAIEGVLTHKENAFLCRPGDPGDLANSVLELRNDASLREKIGTNGYKYFENNFSAEAIGKSVLNIITSTLKR